MERDLLQLLSFLCFITEIPCHTPHSSFVSMATGWVLSSTGPPSPSLTITHSPDLNSLQLMEDNSNYAIKVLRSDLNTEGITGEFFIKCLKHLAVILSRDRENLEDSRPSNSALLECEEVMPLSLSEIIKDSSALHVTAALCESLSDGVLGEAPLPSLLESCGDILASHARVLDRHHGNVSISVVQECPYEERIVGGLVSLNIVIGLMSAVLVGTKQVS